MNTRRTKIFWPVIGFLAMAWGPFVGAELPYDYEGSCCPSGFSCCEEACGYTTFVRGDLLYFKPYESQLDERGSFSAEDSIGEGDLVVSMLTNHSKEPAFNWDLGFRVAAGMACVNSGWDLGAYWMHYQTKTHRGWQQNCMNWSLNVDVVDVLLGRTFCCGDFSVRPYGGARGIQIRQHVRAQFFHMSDSFGDVIAISDFASEQEKLQAGGFLLGVEGDYAICYGFRLYASAAISALYGQFHLKSYDLATSSMGESTTSGQKRFNSCTHVGDLAVGLRWSTCLTEQFRLVQQIAWEHHCFFDYNQIGRNGDLSLDGVGYFASIEF